jgi:hypothetical protein
METIQPTPVVDDETALDKELADSIASVQAGKPLAPAPEAPTTPEVKSGETPVKPKEEPTSPAPATAPEVTSETPDLRIPNKGKFESDESFEKRVELFDLVKRRRAAVTPEQKQALSQQIQTAKGQMKTLNGSDKIINPPNVAEPIVQPQVEDEATKADRERLKALGGVTKEDIANMLSERDTTANIKNTLEDFVKRHSELKDSDVREVFFDFVDSNYNWNGKTGKNLMTVLELARENMFKPSESIQERVLKGANVQEKVNAMQFPGGTTIRTELSAADKKSLDELKATGLSEEVALELMSEE